MAGRPGLLMRSWLAFCLAGLAACATTPEVRSGKTLTLLLPQGEAFANLASVIESGARSGLRDAGQGLELATQTGPDTQAVLGPLLSQEVAPLLASLPPSVPVVSLSNDSDLAGSGAVISGITAEQSVAAILIYARARGVRTVRLHAGEGTPWERRGLAQARATADAIGLIHLEGGEAMADAVLIPGNDAASLRAAKAHASAGGQVLATSLWLQLPSGPDGPTPGAWISGPDLTGLLQPGETLATGAKASALMFAGLAREGSLLLALGPAIRSELLGDPRIRSGPLGRYAISPDGTCDAHWRSTRSAMMRSARLPSRICLTDGLATVLRCRDHACRDDGVSGDHRADRDRRSGSDRFHDAGGAARERPVCTCLGPDRRI